VYIHTGTRSHAMMLRLLVLCALGLSAAGAHVHLNAPLQVPLDRLHAPPSRRNFQPQEHCLVTVAGRSAPHMCDDCAR
jgi:hypothetical protein